MPASKSLAGIYHVYSCRIPYGPSAGEPAPVQVASGAGEEAGRWSKATSGEGAAGTDTCGTPEGALTAELTGHREHSDLDDALWTFTAPEGEKIIEGTRLWRSGDASGGSGYGFWFAAPNDLLASPDVFGPSCLYNAGCHTAIGSASTRLSPSNEVEVLTENVPSSHLYINASCSSASCPSSSGDEQGHAVVVYVYAADIALEQQSDPSVSEVSGELASATQLSGTASLDFHATDSGSGVYKAIVSIDGKAIDSPIVGEGELCKEAAVPAEDQPAFLSAQPCSASTAAHVSLDTTQLSNGSHKLLVEVSDAAGNLTPVVERTIEVDNGSASQLLSAGQTGGSPTQSPVASLQPVLSGAQANGTPASSRASLSASWVAGHDARVDSHGQRLTGEFDHAHTIAGRLTDAEGKPIADAEVAVTSRSSYGGAPSVPLADVRTGAQGRFTITLRKASASQRLQLTYSPTIDGAPVAVQSLTLLVKAKVLLHVSPAVVSAGETVRLRGRILGGPMPQGGKQIVLEARSSGSPWLQFLVVRSGRGGRFQGSHRFRLAGPVHYQFRAVCPQEADFPYATGASGNVSVWER
jgi:hypothetical protein